MSENFDLAFTEFLDAVQQGINTIPESVRGSVILKSGSKNIKVMQKGFGSLSVYCFVEKATGDILKPASYKAAVKGARGNIYKPSTYEGARRDPYGGWLYLRL